MGDMTRIRAIAIGASSCVLVAACSSAGHSAVSAPVPVSSPSSSRACDLRGHGMSEAPLEPEHYTDARLWADDVAAIIEELRLDRPVLVGWSYGAFVICDFVRVYGQDQIAAIEFVEGAAKLGETAFGTLIGPGFLDHFVGATAGDLPTNIAVSGSLRDRFHKISTASTYDESHRIGQRLVIGRRGRPAGRWCTMLRSRYGVRRPVW